MDKIDSYRIVPSEPKSELQQFASWFHQDWELIFSNFHEAAEMYLGSISAPRMQKLRQELGQFIDSNKRSRPSDILEEWYKLGAQGWQSDLDILPTLHDFLQLTEESNSGN